MEAQYRIRKDRTRVEIPNRNFQRDEFGMESLDDYFGEASKEWTKMRIQEHSKAKDKRNPLEPRDLRARSESSVVHNTQAHSLSSEIVQSPREEPTIMESSSQIPSHQVHNEWGADEPFGIDDFNDIDASEGSGDFNEGSSGDDESNGSNEINGSSELNGKYETYGNDVIDVIDEIEDPHSSESGGAHMMQMNEDLDHQDLSDDLVLIEVPEVLISPEKRHTQKSVSLEVIQENVHHGPPVNPTYDLSISYLDTLLDIPESSHEDRKDEDYNTSYIPSSPIILENLRRSRRVRVPPLAFWRNERIVYKHFAEVDPDVPKALARALEMIPLQTIQRVINIPEKPFTIRKRPQKQAQRRNPRERSEDQGEIMNQEPDPEIDVPAIVGPEMGGPGADFPDIERPQIEYLETGDTHTDNTSIDNYPIGNSPIGKSSTESPQIEMPLIDETPLGTPKIDTPPIGNPKVDKPPIDKNSTDAPSIEGLSFQDSQIDDPQIDDPEWFRSKSLASKVFEKGGTTRKRIVSWAPEGADFQHPSKDAGNYRLAPLFNTDPKLASGLLELPIGGFKNSRASNEFNFVFHVIKGLIEVTFNATKIMMREGCSFEVPKFNEYSLKNLGRETASLFFCWSQPPKKH